MTIELGMITVLMAVVGGLLGWILSHERRVSVLETQHVQTAKLLENIANSLAALVQSVHTMEVAIAQRRAGDHRGSD